MKYDLASRLPDKSLVAANDYYLEEQEMGELNSASSTPTSLRKVNMIVTSSEQVEVSVLHSYVVSNPAADEENQLSQLSDTKTDPGSE